MRWAVACGIAVVAIAGACSDPTGGTGPGRVTVVNNAFRPPSIGPAEDGTVTWTWNSGGEAHNVTWDDASGGSSGDLGTGTYVRDFSAEPPGTYTYQCTLHNGMNGQVVVPAP